MGEEELGAELVGEEELDEVEGLKVVGGVKLLQKLTPPTGRQRKAEVRVVVVVLVAVVLVVRSASSSSSSSFMGRGLGLKPNLTYDPPPPRT